MQGHYLMLPEKMSSVEAKATIITSSVNIPDDDDDAIHSRHTISSRQKIQEAASKRRNKSGLSNKQINNTNRISPLADKIGVRGEPLKGNSNNDNTYSDMKWSTIGDKKIPGTEELDKLASLIPQPVSPDSSAEAGATNEEPTIAAVSPEALSPAFASQQRKEVLMYPAYKTPQKTPASYKNAHVLSAEETPITELFDYYNFPNESTNENNKSMSPTTSSMLQTSPFIVSGKLLDDQLLSVLEADLSMERKLEKMEKDLDDSYMGSPMSGILDRGDSGDEDNSDNDSNRDGESAKKIGTGCGESISDFSDAVAEFGDETLFLSPDMNSNAVFLTPKSRLVAKSLGTKTAGTAYYTARNNTDDNSNECDRMYDSDSETYSVRKTNMLQQEDRQRSASCETQITNFICTGGATAMRASLNWEFDAEDDTSNHRGTSDVEKVSHDVMISRTLHTNPMKHQHRGRLVNENNARKHLNPTTCHDNASSNEMEGISHPCALQLSCISEENNSHESIQITSFESSDRDELLNAINVMRAQITELKCERDALAAERENIGLSAQVGTLEEELQISHHVVENVKETFSLKADETNCLKEQLDSRDEEFGRLKAALVSKADEVKELLVTLKEREVDIESLSLSHQIDIERVTAELNRAHSNDIARLECHLKEVHASELELVKATLAQEFEDESAKKNSESQMRQIRETSEELAQRNMQEIDCTVEILKASQLDELKVSHAEEFKLLQDGYNRLNAYVNELRKENDDFKIQVSKLKETNEDLTTSLSAHVENQRLSEGAAQNRELSLAKRCSELELMLQESEAKLIISNDDKKVLEETVFDLTKNLRTNQAELDCALQEKDEVKHQLLDSQAKIDSLKQVKIEVESKYATLIKDYYSLEEVNSALKMENAGLEVSLREVTENTSLMTNESKSLQSEVGLLNAEKDKIAAELEDAVLLKIEIEDKFHTSEDERITMKEDISALQSQLCEANLDRKNLSHTLKDMSRLYEELSHATQSSEARLAELESENRALSRVKNTLQLKSDKVESLNATARAELDEGSKKMEQLRKEYDELNNDLAQLKVKFHFESEKTANLAAEKADLEYNSRSMQNERNSLRRQVDESLLSCETLLLTLEQARQHIQVKSEETESVNAKSAAKLVVIHKKADILSDENIHVKTEVEELHSQHQSGITKIAKEILENSNLNVKLKYTQQELESMLIALEDARFHVQEKKGDIHVQAENCSLEVELKALQQERDRLQLMYDEVVVSQETLQLALENTRSKVQEQSAEIVSLHASALSECDKRDEILGGAQTDIANIEKTLKAVEMERDLLRQQHEQDVVSEQAMQLSLRDARLQIHRQSMEIESLHATAEVNRVESSEMINVLKNGKLDCEKQLKSSQKNHDDLQLKFDASLATCESLLSSLEEARSQINEMKNQVRELGGEVKSKDDALKVALYGKKEATTSIVRFESIAAKLAVNVLQLKHKSYHDRGRIINLSAELESKNEKINYLQSRRQEARNDTPAELNLKSTIARLAFTLVELKVREIRARKAKRTLSSDHIEVIERLEVKTKENEGMEEGMSALSDKINSLELDLGSNREALDELQNVVSKKNVEIKRLRDLLAGKDAALKDVTNEMQTIRTDVMSSVKRLETEHANSMRVRAQLEGELDDANTQLDRERERVFNLESDIDLIISEKNDIQDDLVDLQGTHFHLENHLEQVTQDRSHLQSQIEGMHDSIASLEADRDSLMTNLEESQEQTNNFTKRIAALEANVKSNERQIDYMEFQLVSKMDEAEALNKMVVSHEATMKDLNDEIESMDAKRSETEKSLSSLHSMMNEVINERDGFATQLKAATEELQLIRVERNRLRSAVGNHAFPCTSPEKIDSSEDVDTFAANSPGQGIRQILESSTISREDIDFICSNMDKSKTVLTQVGKERKLLKKEVKLLHAELNQAKEELKSVKKHCKVANQHTLLLRGDVNEANALLKECEAEKDRLTSNLEAAHEALVRVQQCSSDSYEDLKQRNQQEISRLKSELESKEEAIEQLNALRVEHISKFDITSDSIPSSQQPTVVTSTERFKVERGQSMFGILKGKRSKRKGRDQLSYRKQKS